MTAPDTWDHDGAVVWLSANCIDHGVADGRVVEYSGAGVHVDAD